VADVHPYAQMLRQAPATVLVCADVSLETCPNNWGVDCSAAMQNLLLAAHAVGLSSVWVGIFPHEERMQDIATALALPAHIRPVSLAPLGHPKNPLPAADRFLPERIHRNGW
jgi:nitroreductase